MFCQVLEFGSLGVWEWFDDAALHLFKLVLQSRGPGRPWPRPWQWAPLGPDGFVALWLYGFMALWLSGTVWRCVFVILFLEWCVCFLVFVIVLYGHCIV